MNDILDQVTIFMKKNNYDILELKNLNTLIQNKIDKEKFFTRNFAHTPYLIKFNKKFNKRLINFYKTKLLISYLDGDCLI